MLSLASAPLQPPALQIRITLLTNGFSQQGFRSAWFTFYPAEMILLHHGVNGINTCPPPAPLKWKISAILLYCSLMVTLLFLYKKVVLDCDELMLMWDHCACALIRRWLWGLLTSLFLSLCSDLPSSQKNEMCDFLSAGSHGSSKECNL